MIVVQDGITYVIEERFDFFLGPAELLYQDDKLVTISRDEDFVQQTEMAIC